MRGASSPGRPVAWTIAGSDSSAGAGIQADLRAFDAMDVQGCTVIAAITAQNSVGVTRIDAVPTAWLDAQLAALADDMPPDAIELGMLGSADNLRCVMAWIDRLRLRAPVALVVDPLWRASTGADLADDTLRGLIRDELLPRTTVATPNRAEAAWLLGREVAASEVPQAAKALRRLGASSVVVTGGDDGGDQALDWIDTPEDRGWLALPRIATSHHHGSGCAFAASVAAAMARGFCAADAAVLAKMSVAAGLQAAEAFAGIGPGGSVGRGAGAVRPMPGFARRPELLPRLFDNRSIEREAFAPLADESLGLYAIVDSAHAIDRLLAAGARTLQLRIKDSSRDDLSHQIARSVRAAKTVGAQLFINDHWRLAIDHGAYGVHLGQEDLSTADLPAIRHAGLRLGISTHSLWELCRAVAHAPSYVACGPVHPTTTKAMPWRPQGNGNLAWWCAVAGRPVVAIAGMDLTRGAEAVRCGASGVAVLRGIAQVDDTGAVVRGYLEAWREAAASARIAPSDLPRPSYTAPASKPF